MLRVQAKGRMLRLEACRTQLAVRVRGLVALECKAPVNTPDVQRCGCELRKEGCVRSFGVFLRNAAPGLPPMLPLELTRQVACGQVFGQVQLLRRVLHNPERSCCCCYAHQAADHAAGKAEGKAAAKVAAKAATTVAAH